MTSQAIGIFDSGVGGLTVYQALKKSLPQENFIYLGDTARVPYGTKSQETVKKYSIQNGEFLTSKNVKVIIVACNTASAFSLDSLEEKFSVPVIGVVKPGAKAAVATTSSNRIGIIGTEGTLNSKVYETEIKEIDNQINAKVKATPLFVPLVEEGIDNPEILFPIFDLYLREFKGDVDTLVLGCTHYPLLKNKLNEYFSGDIKLIDSAFETANTVKSVLTEKNLLNNSGGQSEFYVTDKSQRTERIFQNILQDKALKITRASIE